MIYRDIVECYKIKHIAVLKFFIKKKREIRGVVDACKTFDKKSGIIITNEAIQDFEVDKIKIEVVPLYQWLL